MSDQNIPTRKARYSLRRSLLLWLLLLALVPLTLMAWLGYRQAVNGLTTAAIQKLEQGSQLKEKFIQNWFSYRFVDLNTQAEDSHNIKLLLALKQAWRDTDQKLGDFVKSDTWARLTNTREKNLRSLVRQYDYIYDLLLIDDKGNILYSVTRESSLGNNLFSGSYADTRFAHTSRISMETGQKIFSDLEYYAPSNNSLAGFLTAPLQDDQGNLIGVLAIQLRLERVSELMQHQNSDSSLIYYLVGEDGLLRTFDNEKKTASDLQKRIETKRFKHWQYQYTKRNKHQVNEYDKQEFVFEYSGPDAHQVIGIHREIKLPGVNWILISEIDRDEALLAAHRLGRITLAIFLFTVVLVLVLAFYLARRITGPIIKLADASMAVAEGQLDQQVVIQDNNEISVLARAFNHMLAVRQNHELTFEQSSRDMQKVLTDLAEQKFALDQHAIVAITDMQGTITFANDRFSEISGYSRDELLGQNHRLINSGHHATVFFHDMYQTIMSGEVWHGEICNKAKDGHLYWVDTTIVPFLNSEIKPKTYIYIRTDITKRKQVELDLLDAKEVAEAATRHKSDFLANMSHEIRTPMNGIIGMTGLLLDTHLNAKQRSHANTTMRSADALLTIINDILDFSKIEAGKLDLEEVPFDLQSLVEDVAELMALKCQEKGVEMLLRYKPGTEQFVIGDPGRVRQILLNLLSNAIKFTEQGHIVLSVGSSAETDEIVAFCISVQDSGIGIAEDRQEHIFNKFDQEDSSTTRKYGGTGLGLAICQQLCSMMQGDIKVESNKEQGSTFTFSIKLKVNKQAPSANARSESYEQLKGLKTLIVDDSDMACTILEEQLLALQMYPLSVSSGEEVIHALEKAIADHDPFDIVIMDYHMPEMDGEALVKELSKRDLLSNGVMLFVTSSAHKGPNSRLKSLGFDGYLSKPTYPAEIAQILSLVWDAKQQGQDVPLVSRHMLKEVKTAGRKKPVFTHIQILLVEDNPVNVMVATELLEGYGCTVTPAGNGLEALLLVKARSFDLIFMDCLMPEMDGFEATLEIRKLEAKRASVRMPIVAFTANAMQTDQEKCLDAGMDDYISKPVSQEALEDVLATWLSHKLVTITHDEKEKTSTSEQTTDITVEHSAVLDMIVFDELKHLFADKFTSVIEHHVQRAHENVKRMDVAIQQGDIDTLERLAHSLKSASAQFGALHLNVVALEMEILAQSGALDNAGIVLNKLRTAQEQLAVAMRQQIGTDKKTLLSGRVLVVDDNVVNQDVAQGILEKFGVVADVAANGLEAIHALEVQDYDLVFMDCQMPIMDGLEATQQIRDPSSKVKKHNIPIIAMTANSSKRDREQCLAIGMDDYASKPVSPVKLQKLLLQWLPKDISPDSKQEVVMDNVTANVFPHSKIPVFDYAAMSSRLMNDEALMRTVMEAFLLDMAQQIEQLKSVVVLSDVQQVTLVMHNIKGASANVGGMALSDLAFQMEQHADDPEKIRKDLGNLEQGFVQLKAAMTEALYG